MTDFVDILFSDNLSPCATEASYELVWGKVRLFMRARGLMGAMLAKKEGLAQDRGMRSEEGDSIFSFRESMEDTMRH